MVVADNHSYAVQPRPHHPDEVIVWEMDESTLPRGVIDGGGEYKGHPLPASKVSFSTIQFVHIAVTHYLHRFAHPDPILY